MKSKEMLVSILMPAFNCEQYVRLAIECILNQSYTNIELLIADDASKDKTRKIIDSYTDPRIVRYHNDENLGYLKTWNKLIAQAKGEYITFLDADDLCELNRIEVLLDEFEKDPELGACGSNFKRIDEHGKLISQSSFVLTHDDIVSKIPHFDMVGSAIMIKKEVYKQVGGYNEYFDRIGAEDFYWIYLISEKFKVANFKEPLYSYRHNFNSISGNLSDDYRKMFSPMIVSFLITQRIKNGYDSLSGGNKQELSDFVSKQSEPYISDKCYHFKNLAKRYFYEGRKKDACRLQFYVCIKQFGFQNVRDFFYYLRK